jgi:hypothetical protein
MWEPPNSKPFAVENSAMQMIFAAIAEAKSVV